MLLLVEGPGTTGPLRWPPSEGHFVRAGFTSGSWGWQKGQAEWALHRAAPGTTLHIPLLLPSTAPAMPCWHRAVLPAARSCHPTAGVSPRTRPATAPGPRPPCESPAAGTSRLLFLALLRCTLPAMAPYITIIAGCQRLEAGRQDRDGASTPLVTCHSVLAGLWSSTGYFRKSNLMARRSTRYTFSPCAGSRLLLFLLRSRF